jgi:hypothetical protein
MKLGRDAETETDERFAGDVSGTQEIAESQAIPWKLPTA